jgi:hypothetical protein
MWKSFNLHDITPETQKDKSRLIEKDEPYPLRLSNDLVVRFAQFLPLEDLGKFHIMNNASYKLTYDNNQLPSIPLIDLIGKQFFTPVGVTQLNLEKVLAGKKIPHLDFSVKINSSQHIDVSCDDSQSGEWDVKLDRVDFRFHKNSLHDKDFLNQRINLIEVNDKLPIGYKRSIHEAAARTKIVI